MLVNKINSVDNSYKNPISFRSKFVPNDALKDAFYIAGIDAKGGSSTWQGINSRSFAKIIDGLLNDGKDDLIKVTRSKHGSSLIINEHRVHFYSEHPPELDVDGSRVINNFVDYYTTKFDNPFLKLSTDEFKAIKPEIDNLNAELNADDVTKNPEILFNLRKNTDNIDFALIKHTVELLDKLKIEIFGK